MKKILFALVLALLAATAPAFAASQATVTGVVEATSDTLYRGKSFTNDKAAVTLGLRADNVLVNGVFVQATGTTIDVGNLDRDGRLRTEYVVGYGRSFGDLSLVGSVARVQNPVIYAQDYTEARLDAAYALTQKLAVTGQYAQILTDAVGQDRYASLGLEYRGLFVPELTVGGLASYQSYKKSDRSEFNNAELFVTYALTKNVEAFGKYSWGGKSITHATDAFSFLDYRASDLKDQGQVGLRVRF